MSIELLIGIIAVLLAVQAFFAGSEIAIISCNKVKIKVLAEKGSKNAKLFMRLLPEIEMLLSTSLVGINLSLIVSTVVLTFYLENKLGHASEFYTIAILSPLIVVFGQVVPKAIFQTHSDKMALIIIYPLWIASKLFSPALYVVRIFIKAMMKSIGRTEAPLVTREELIEAIQIEEAVSKRPIEELIMKRIFEFSETRADEIMIPLVHLKAVSGNTSVKDTVKLIKETGHTRLPIYEERVDNITGVLHAFYLIGADDETPVKTFSKEPRYVPESKPVDELLDDMKRSRTGMAIVVDEYGGAVGAVTIEDILEEVVGEIEDEYDTGVRLWRKVSDNEYLLNPRIEIDMANEELSLGLPEGDYETLGGFLLERFGSIPKSGESVKFENKTFHVNKATSRAIEEVRLHIEK